MHLRRGLLVTVVASIMWLGFAFATRPNTDVAADRTQVSQAVDRVDAWLFTRYVLMPAEWSTSIRANEQQAWWVDQTRQSLAETGKRIQHRLKVISALAGLGVIAFWFGLAALFRARRAAKTVGARTFGRGIVACISLTMAGFWLPCIPVEGPRGLVFSAPPLIAGLIALGISVLAAGARRAGAPAPAPVM
jgi:hypothetical protein